MRVMAIDYGDARTGIAISDMSCKIAGEALVVAETGMVKLADKICRLAELRDVSTIVVGHPLNMNASRGPRAEKSEALAEYLRQRCNKDVVLQDERRTTVDAHRILQEAGKNNKKRKQTVDAVAASLILETYLNKLNLNGG